MVARAHGGSILAAWLIALVGLAPGCGPRVDVGGPVRFEDDLDDDGAHDDGDDGDDGDDADGDDTDRNPTAARDPLPSAAVATPRPPGERTGTIARAALDAVLAAGPPMFLRGFEVTRHLDGRGEFDGWKIVQFLPSDRFAGVDLQPDDVIGEVNGRVLSRPDDLQAVWDELPRASELAISVRRGAARFVLRYAIVGQPAVATEASASPAAASAARP